LVKPGLLVSSSFTFDMISSCSFICRFAHA